LSTIPPISTERTTRYHHKLLNTEKTSTEGLGNPGLGLGHA